MYSIVDDHHHQYPGALQSEDESTAGSQGKQERAYMHEITWAIGL